MIDDVPRNATCYAMTERVIAAIVTKNDYKRVLLERDRYLMDQKVNKIRQFDFFKDMSKRRLNKIYRFFYHAKT